MKVRKFKGGIVVIASVLLGTMIYLPDQLASGTQRENIGIYKDVSLEDTHFQNITESNTLGLMTGYPNQTFGPYKKLTRANVVKALGKYIEQSSGQAAAAFDLEGVEPFLDVPAHHGDPELYKYSLLVKKVGVFKGSNNHLMPTQMIQRQQMAQVIVRAFHLEDIPNKNSRIIDNEKAFSDEERRAIDILSKHDITSIERFRPTESTYRGQLASFLVAAYHAAHDDLPPPVVTNVTITDI